MDNFGVSDENVLHMLQDEETLGDVREVMYGCRYAKWPMRGEFCDHLACGSIELEKAYRIRAWVSYLN